MLRDGAMTMNSSEMTSDDRSSWQSIDRELRSIARRQRALDAEEAELLCRASREQVWRKFGCATMLEYLELIFGYAPKVGHERLRVAILCDGHHIALHHQKIVITGAAPNLEVRFVNQPTAAPRATHATGRHTTPRIDSRSKVESSPHVETPPKLDGSGVMTAEAKQALESLGFKPTRSKQLVERAIASEPTPVTLEELIRVALRYSR